MNYFFIIYLKSITFFRIYIHVTDQVTLNSEENKITDGANKNECKKY